MSHTHTNIHKTNNESEHGIFFSKISAHVHTKAAKLISILS